MRTAVETLLAIVLAGASVLKLRAPARSALDLATYGIAPPARLAALYALSAAELGVAGSLLADAPWAGAAAAGLFALFAGATAAALAAGRAGRPCACFGGGARLSRTSPLPALAAAVLSIAVAERWLAAPQSNYERWLTAGLVAAAVAIVVLAATVFALAREVGVLRLSIASQGALEIPGEGPRLGERQPWAAELPQRPGTLLGLAIFSSEGCPMCRRLAPAVEYVAADPLLAVRVFDEVADAAVWAAAAVPGSPYAIALDAAGVTLAKGTFNSLVQLEGLLATAREREAEPALAL
jgi:Methylamine utilisation protein MauE